MASVLFQTWRHIPNVSKSFRRVQLPINVSLVRLSSTSVSQRFDEAQGRLKTLTTSPGNEAKLKLYALFKQATVGAVNVKRPGMTDFVGKAKWDAWNALGTISQEEAKQKYIDYVDSLVGSAPEIKSSNVGNSSSSAFAGFEIKSDGKLKIVRFNKPDKKNALSTDMYVSFVQILKETADDPATSVLAVTGTGNFFSSGNDLTNFTSFSGPSVEDGARNGKTILLNFVDALIDFPKPIVGVVNGPGLGIACTMLALMDVVYASDRCWLQTPFSALGQSPEACSSLTFPRLMGALKANEILLFNKKITADEACRLGLVSQVFPESTFDQEIWPKLKAFSELPVKSLVYSKELGRQFDRDLLHKVNAVECERLMERWLSDDCMEAIMKFFSNKK